MLKLTNAISGEDLLINNVTHISFIEPTEVEVYKGLLDGDDPEPSDCVSCTRIHIAGTSRFVAESSKDVATLIDRHRRKEEARVLKFYREINREPWEEEGEGEE